VTKVEQHAIFGLVDPSAAQASHPSRADLRFDTVRITAWVYTVYSLTLYPVKTLRGIEPLPPGGKAALAIFCVAFATAAWSTTRRKRIGYYFCLLFSIAILPGFPMGTVLGWNMLRALRQNRSLFWPHAPRPSWMRRTTRSGV
jgi:hypothetical protein